MLRSGKPQGCARVCLRGFFRAVPWRGVRLERSQKLARDRGYLVDSGSECGFVCLRRLVEAAHFPQELQRGRTNLVLGDRGFEIEQDPDVSAHDVGSTEKIRLDRRSCVSPARRRVEQVVTRQHCRCTIYRISVMRLSSAVTLARQDGNPRFDTVGLPPLDKPCTVALMVASSSSPLMFPYTMHIGSPFGDRNANAGVPRTWNNRFNASVAGSPVRLISTLTK